MKLRQKLRSLPFIRDYLKEVDIPVERYNEPIDRDWDNYILMSLNSDEDISIRVIRVEMKPS